MKLSLSVTHPMPPQMIVAGMVGPGAAAPFTPGKLMQIPRDPEPAVIVETEADGIPADAVVAVLRAAADEVERLGRMGVPDVLAGRRKGMYPGALTDRARDISYRARHRARPPRGYAESIAADRIDMLARGGYIGAPRGEHTVMSFGEPR